MRAADSLPDYTPGRHPVSFRGVRITTTNPHVTQPMLDQGDRWRHGLMCRHALNLPRCADLELIVSASYFGLWDAAEKFNPERFVNWGTFVHERVKHCIQEEKRRQLGRVLKSTGVSTRMAIMDRCVSLEAMMEDDDGDDDFRRAIFACTRSLRDFDHTDAQIAVPQLLKHTHKRDREAVERYFFQGQSLRETCASMGVSMSRVEQMINRAVEMMREGAGL